jgi:2,4-dienoyl-CoA reductase-like NADH-dependent reductase (Old Yellow Enzyme family)
MHLPATSLKTEMKSEIRDFAPPRQRLELNFAHTSRAKIPVGPGYQTAFANRIRRETEIMTGAVGMVTSPIQAEHIIRT